MTEDSGKTPAEPGADDTTGDQAGDGWKPPEWSPKEWSPPTSSTDGAEAPASPWGAEPATPTTPLPEPPTGPTPPVDTPAPVPPPAAPTPATPSPVVEAPVPNPYGDVPTNPYGTEPSFTPPPGQTWPPPAGTGPGAPGVVKPPTHPLAITSLVTGLLGVMCCFFLVLGVVATVTGYLAKKQIAESGGRYTGSEIAQAGFVLGIITTVVGLISLATGGFGFSFG